MWLFLHEDNENREAKFVSHKHSWQVLKSHVYFVSDIYPNTKMQSSRMMGLAAEDLWLCPGTSKDLDKSFAFSGTDILITGKETPAFCMSEEMVQRQDVVSYEGLTPTGGC